MRKRMLLVFSGLCMISVFSVFWKNASAWSNGGYSDDPTSPDYGTHDWIAEHALDWLPAEEKPYILDNLAAYLYGTELPDNGGAPDGIGDTAKHHIYYNSAEVMTDDAAAVRASTEYSNTLNFLKARDYAKAAKNAGVMSHYIVDMAVFGHVMGAGTDWGAEVHHSDYETYVNGRTSSYSAEFSSYLSFDGSLTTISAYDAARNLAYDTTFDVDGDLTCVWMDQNYDWSNPTFKNRAGESLNLAVNCLTDILHTLYLEAPDIAPPITTDDYDKVWRTADFAITLVATDLGSGVAETYYKINNGPIQNVSTHGQPRITTEGANNKLEYWSVDKAGNEELPHKVLTGIKLDKTAPSGSVLINNDDANTTTLIVSLSLSADDATSGVSQMRFSNNATTWTSWEAYLTSKSWTLSIGDGTKTVYVQYKDNAGLFSSTYQDTIELLDVTHPTTTISLSGVEGNNGWFISDVTVTLLAIDDVSGVDKTEYSFDNVTWTTYTADLNIANDGNNLVYYKSTDKAGNPETAELETIKVDKTAPSGSIEINDDDDYTTSTSLMLTLTATDPASGVYKIRLSNNGAWDTEPWETPTLTRTWTVTSRDGVKTVYYQIKDNAGLISQSCFDAIILDTTAPTILITSPSLGYEIRSSTVTVTWTGSDETSGVNRYEIRLDGDSWTNVGTNTTHTFTELGDGSHTIDLKATDKAGNTKEDTVNFTVNTSPLFGPGYMEEAAITATIIIIALGITLYFLKVRKH